MSETEQLHDGDLLKAFAETGDEAAFAAIVQRHGAMVQGICLRILGDFHEAQDVAQAVFLALARKAGRLRKDPSIGGWLHHVATCLARNTRTSDQSRKRREKESMKTATSTEPVAGTPHPLREELDHAVEQLPSRYRLPLVLFHFEERTLEEIARALGLNASAVSARLVRGREMLRAKLVRRGVAVGSVAALTTLLSAEAGAAVLPSTFVSTTVQAAGLAAAGKLAAGVGTGVVSAQVAALTKGAIDMVFWSSVKTAAVTAAAAIVVAGGSAMVAQELATQRQEPAQPAAAEASQMSTMEDEIRRAQALMEKGKTTSELASTLADEEARLEAMKASRTDFQQAADILQKAVEDNPAHGLAPKVKLLAGQCLMRAENWDAAIPVFTAASENKAAAASRLCHRQGRSVARVLRSR